VISIVIPAFNEAENIPELLDQIAGVMARAGEAYELIVVDDGSTDATWTRLAAAVERFPAVRAIRFSRNFGKEAAIAAGLESAAGDAAIVMDADLQHPPALIAQMIARWRQGDVDIVEAVKSERGQEPRSYRFVSRMFYTTLERWAGVKMLDASDFCLLDARVVRQWRRFPEHALFFRGMSAWLGFRRARVEFAVQPRLTGTTKWTVLGLTRLALHSITAFTSVPLHLITLLGLFTFVMAALLGTRIIVLKLSGEVIDGLTTIILLLLFTGSSLMIALGIIGEYIARIYDEVKARPRYIVAEQMNIAACEATSATSTRD
jgi:polyisoprenyl-phosphate glycosyltransferase